MANSHFYLRNKNAGKDTPIILYIQFQNKTLKYSTGLKVNPTYWDFSKERFKQSSKVSDPSTKNNFLTDLEKESINSHDRLLTQGSLSKENIKKELDLFTERIYTEEPMTLFRFINLFIEERQNDRTSKHGTTKNLNTAFNNLKDYCKHKRKKKELSFDDINLDFKSKYQTYLFKEKNHSQNYASKQLDLIRQFMRAAEEREYHSNRKYASRSFSIKKIPTDSIYLTLDELNTLYKFDLSENKRLERVRDLFIISSFTGLRFSDFTKLAPKHIIEVGGTEVIHLTTQKTDSEVWIPLSKEVKSIFLKYKGELPNRISGQKFNTYIKEVCLLVGIEKERSQRVSAHTGRRSFVSNQRLLGRSDREIMQMTGHSTLREFGKYDKVSAKDNAILIAEKGLFTPKLRAVK